MAPSAARLLRSDVKLANVLLNERAEGRLGDFGLAEQLPHGGDGLLASVCGTHDCMAPEMVRCGHGEVNGYGREVDLWAVGLMAYEMLVGHHPFQRPTEIATLTAILAADLVFPPEAAVTDAAKDLIRRLLEPEPDRRATAVDALRHAWLCGGEVLPVSDGAPRSRAASHVWQRPSVVKSALSMALGRQTVGHT